MSKPDRKKWPNLSKAWDDYGHMIKWEDLFDMKTASHYYVVLAWKEEDGMVNYADLASADRGETWEWQNDGHEPIELALWRKARIKPDCDWLIFPGEEE